MNRKAFLRTIVLSISLSSCGRINSDSYCHVSPISSSSNSSFVNGLATLKVALFKGINYLFL